MGFDKPKESNFIIPVSDSQAYRQFGNSVVVPVFSAVAELMKSRIYKAVKIQSQTKQRTWFFDAIFNKNSITLIEEKES